MGARPSQFKKGGGFLNNVDGVIADYVFTDEFNGEPFRAGKDPKTKKEKFHSLYFLLSGRADGADENVSTSLFAGGADDFNISEDGKTIWDAAYETEEEAIAAEAEKPGSTRSLGAGTALGKFITSLVQAGFPETSLPEDRINFEPIVSTRVRFVQKKDEESTKKLGKRKDAKTGKEYDRQDLLVDQVYDLPGAEAPAAVATPAKKVGVGKTPPTSQAKPLGGAKAGAKGKAAAPAAVDIDALTTTTLTAILAEERDAETGIGSIQKSKLSMRVLKALMKDPNRDDVRKRIFEDAFLGSKDAPWAFDKATGVIEMEVPAPTTEG